MPADDSVTFTPAEGETKQPERNTANNWVAFDTIHLWAVNYIKVLIGTYKHRWYFWRECYLRFSFEHVRFALKQSRIALLVQPWFKLC